ncbi:DMSO/TMAO reductase YedYZ, molybdopterin-dependent catalytic subunit [Geodermatophilus saharensis]|uniref:DMSO/TMAO reductase YedYZ, molybdopterin-dependent catalytic subunit n=1 Tax=Geodermatophilus saharensis TaxID=1137994 RepID=A0A239A033_9ACTN|nr:molybdopterin-dependent oxidoreductase [Geodermatophilus saharensis]SNR88253.1 DMSO/TMAO reductase YedYZ, molybdopterin-dependent catalytic subunit [Geodermatophilus saharensis]
MTAQRTSRPRIGLLAGLLAAAAGEITASATRRGRSPSSGLARGLVDASPAALVDGGVALVGRADKPGLAVLAAGAGGLAAAAGGALAGRRPLLGAATAAAPHVLGGSLALRRGDASTRDTAAAAAAGLLVAATAVAPLRVRPSVVPVAAAVAAGAVVAADRRARRRAAGLRDRITLPPPARPLPRPPADAAARQPGLAPLLAEPGELPVIDVTVPEPRVDVDAWRLVVDGEVAEVLALSLHELLALPLDERDLLMVCVHNPVGGRRMGCARWTGLGVGELLDRAGHTGEDGWVVAEAVDGYTNVLPLDVARRAFLAVGMAGRPLPREHGSPARLLVPGRHGQDGNLKWLRRITVTAQPPPSYWGRRGWRDGTYPVHPASRIDAPADHSRVEAGRTTVRGYAWAPTVGVDRVQLRVDDGPWTDAALGVDLGPDAWRPWSAPWEATRGRHRLTVRCRTTDGRWQDETTSTPYPHGVHGAHGIGVQVGGNPATSAVRSLAGQAATRMGWATRSTAAWRNSRSA